MMDEEIDETKTVYDVVFSTPQEPIISSPSSSSPVYAASLSLAEHSYCASSSSVMLSTTSAGETVNDLFAVVGEMPVVGDIIQLSPTKSSINDVVIHSPGITVGLGDYVNFDGFSLTIPSSSENPESLWSFGNGTSMPIPIIQTDLNTIEVTSTEITGNDAVANVNEEVEVIETETVPKSIADNMISRKRTGYTKRPRKRDYIKSSEERKIHFEDIFERLTLQLDHAIIRTGCEGTLTGVFQGNKYPRSDAVSSVEISSNRYENSSVNGLTDDHRYAATILTQNVSSSAVRDHQYVERTTPAAQQSDIDFDDNGNSGCFPSKDAKRVQKGKKYERFDYIKVGWQRDQTFCKAAKSLFSQKCTLEQRTGAVITLYLRYGSCSIDDQNYQNCTSLITRSKQPKKGVARPLAPKPNQTAETGSSSSNAIPVTFILPKSPLCIPVSNTLMSSNIISPNSVSQSISYGQSLSLANSEPEKKKQCIENKNRNSSAAIETSGHYENLVVPFSNTTSLLSVCTVTDNNDHYPDATDDTECSIVSSPRQSSDMKDSACNTSPICSICHGSEAGANTFWIRCNDAFCYYMVHTSCVGFMVTHAAHLKQLPAFYCKRHR